MVSEKMLKLGSVRSSIRELFEYGKIRAAEVGKENVYDFSLGNPSIPSPDGVNETIHMIINNEPSVSVHGYTSAVGDDATRKAIADELNERFETSFTKDNLFITCGAAASLTSVFRALITDGSSEIIAFAPFFPEYRCFVEANGGIFKFVPADTENFQINFDKLTEMLNEKTQAVIINSPNNPSGAIYSEETVKKLAELLDERSRLYGHPIYLVSDEPYRELVYDGIKIPFVTKYYRNSIVSYSYSKSLSLPGERIGYVLIPSECDEFRDLYNAVAGAARAQGYVCAPSLMQRVIRECVGLKPDIGVYQKNRDLLYSKLTEIGYRCAYPQGAFYLFIEAPNGNSEAFGEIAKKYDLLLVPGTGFGCPAFMRAAYCVDYSMIERSITAFEKAFREC